MDVESDHPTDDEMNAYCRSDVTLAVMQRIDRHLDDCAECSRKMAKIVRQLCRERKRETD